MGSTHNLLAALVENAVYRNNACDMAPEGVTWSRVTDASDRALRQITTGLGGSANSPLRETRFDFITASEIMAILALAADPEDLKARLSRMVVGTNRSGDPVSVGDLGLAGPLMAVMRHTVMPNLVQTVGGPAGHRSRRPLRQHRPRVQLHHRRPAGPGLRRLHYHRGRLRLRPGL